MHVGGKASVIAASLFLWNGKMVAGIGSLVNPLLFKLIRFFLLIGCTILRPLLRRLAGAPVGIMRLVLISFGVRLMLGV